MSNFSPIYGQNPTTGQQEPIQTDGNKRLSLNLGAYGGVAVGVGNPLISQEQIRAYAVVGQLFSSTTGLVTSAGAVQTAHSLFNPLASGKTLIVLSIHIATAASAQHHYNAVTTDPVYANAATPVNNKLGGAASIASATFLNAAAGNTGTVLGTSGTGGNTITEVLQNNCVFVIPANNGLIMFISTSTNAWQSTIQWLEV